MACRHRIRFAQAAILTTFLLCFAAAFSEEIPQPQLPQAPEGAVVFLRDSFMRERPEQGEWKHISGTWESDSSTKPGVSAHQFSMRGRAEKEALTVIGEKWWRDYVYSVSLRTPPLYTSFGLVSCYRGQDERIFFGFTAADGLILEILTGAKTWRLASLKQFPISYQWVRLSVAVKGKKAWALLDEKLVFEVEIPIETCGMAGVCAYGVMEYGVTIADCAVTGISGTDVDITEQAKRGFPKLYRNDRLTLQRFP
jgi:hypothetical protein